MANLNRASLWEILRPIFITKNKTEMAIAIVLAETGGTGKTDARNVNRDGSVDRGIFQINNRAHPDVSDSCADNPSCAGRAAFRISLGGTNWNAWTTYKNGAYKKYLGTNSIPDAASGVGILGTGIDVPNPVKPIEEFAKAGVDVIKYLFGSDAGAHYLRIGKIIGGLVLILLGLKSIMGVTVSDVARKVPIPV